MIVYIIAIFAVTLGLTIGFGTLVLNNKASAKKEKELSNLDQTFADNQPEVVSLGPYVGPPKRRTFMDTIRSRLYPQDGVDPHLDLGLNNTLADDPNKQPSRQGVIPLNIETRGAIPNYDQVGYIFNEETEERLPLFGRPKYIGSSQWEYYSKDGSRNKIPLPIDNGNDKELYDDDSVQIQGISGEFNVKLYEKEKLRYVPYIY